MSKTAAAAFVKLVMNDEELRQRTGALKPEEIVPFAKEMGFDFTLDELKEVKKEDIELSPDELEAVAGGEIKCLMLWTTLRNFGKNCLSK